MIHDSHELEFIRSLGKGNIKNSLDSYKNSFSHYIIYLNHIYSVSDPFNFTNFLMLFFQSKYNASKNDFCYL